MVTARKPKRRSADAQRLAIVEAEHAQLRASLVAVLATLPNEWASAEVQAVRRRARAVVEETGVRTNEKGDR